MSSVQVPLHTCRSCPRSRQELIHVVAGAVAVGMHATPCHTRPTPPIGCRCPRNRPFGCRASAFVDDPGQGRCAQIPSQTIDDMSTVSHTSPPSIFLAVSGKRDIRGSRRWRYLLLVRQCRLSRTLVREEAAGVEWCGRHQRPSKGRKATCIRGFQFVVNATRHRGSGNCPDRRDLLHLDQGAVSVDRAQGVGS